MILVVLGGSCSGKTEFALRCKHFGLEKVITNTTRSRRIDDTDTSYHFLSKEEFIRKIDNDDMLEYAEYNGNLYGVSRDSLSANCVVALEPNGFYSLKQRLIKPIFSIFLDVSDEERYKRGILRGDSEEILKSRILDDRLLFDEKLKSSVDMTVKNLKFEDMDALIMQIIEKNSSLNL